LAAQVLAQTPGLSRVAIKALRLSALGDPSAQVREAAKQAVKGFEHVSTDGVSESDVLEFRPDKHLSAEAVPSVPVPDTFLRFADNPPPASTPVHENPPSRSGQDTGSVPKKSILSSSYTSFPNWWLRGRFGGLALMVAFGAGIYAAESGDIGGYAASIIAGAIALLLLGGKGILWTLLIWAAVFILASLSK